jgi:hypothetical protein
MRGAAKRTRLTLVCAALLAGASAFAPADAAADADPASDILLVKDIFLPAPQGPSRPVVDALTTTVRRARAAGYPLKVAVVATATDLGGVPQLFGRPQEYADFLAREIAFNPKARGPLLVVMPEGYGVHNAGKSAGAAVDSLLPPGSTPDDLGTAAVDATVRLAGDAGHKIGKPKLPGKSGGSALVILAVLLGLVAFAGALIVLKRRQK